MSTIREGIARFLSNRVDESPFLIPLWSPSLETQVNVFPGSNQVEDKDMWTDGEQTWFHHRWPYRAMTDPYYKDRQITYSPRLHVDRIGTTWWDFEARQSVAVVFDVDSDKNHDNNALTEQQINEVVAEACKLPYVTFIRSTSGNGRHLYVFFSPDDRPQTNNHNEHSAVAKVVLEKMVEDSGFDFARYMDCQGSNVWFWAASSPAEHNGFSVVREAPEKLPASMLRDWTKLVDKPAMQGYTEAGSLVNAGRPNEEICPLDDDHKEILKELETLGYSFTWVASYNMAHTHTRALKDLFEKRKKEGRPLKGLFETNSAGTDRNKPNCYISPRPGGVFRVCRFGEGTTEHPLWGTDRGKTWCFFNQKPLTFSVLRRFASESSGRSIVMTARNLEQALNLFEETMGESASRIETPIKITLQPDGIFLAEFSGQDGEFPGWEKKGTKWQRQLPLVHYDDAHRQGLLDRIDDVVRHLVTPQGDEYGWVLRSEDHGWISYRAYNNLAASVSVNFGQDAQLVKHLAMTHPWQIVNIPFASEYPGDRKWNWKAPQLAIEPADKPGLHPHWDLIYNHLGKNLTAAVQSEEWCRKWGIEIGADYLRFWVASLIKYPFEPLAYLYMCGPQNSGKSIFCETLNEILFDRGVVKASNALKSGANYNAELTNAVVGWVEETDLSKAGVAAYEKIKEWCTAKDIQVHQKNHTPYQQPNTLHFVHTANQYGSLPLEAGDTRCTVISVDPLEKIIPKPLLEKKLREEAPYFLRTLLMTQIPEPIDRLRVPVLRTEAKDDLEAINQTDVEAFASENLKPCPGGAVKVSDLYEMYRQYCERSHGQPKSLIQFSRSLKSRSDAFLVGRMGANQNYIANVTLTDEKPSEPLKLNSKGRLVPVSEVEDV